MQEAFLRAYKHRNTFRPVSFVSWLYRIASNVVVDDSRKRQEEIRIEIEDYGEGTSAPEMELPNSRLEVLDETRELLRGMGIVLNMREFLVIILKELHGFTYKEIVDDRGLFAFPTQTLMQLYDDMQQRLLTLFEWLSEEELCELLAPLRRRLCEEVQNEGNYLLSEALGNRNPVQQATNWYHRGKSKLLKWRDDQ